MKHILLDSHVFFWAITGSAQLSPAASRLIESAPFVYVSSLTIFELMAKQAKGKLRISGSLADMAESQGLTLLDLSAKQLQNYRIFHDANTDPFDNALLAIAEMQHFHFLTADKDITVLQQTFPWIIKA